MNRLSATQTIMCRKALIDECKIGIMPGSGINDKNCSYFKEAGFKAIHLSGSVPLEPISIPSGVNQEMSFLNQEILESNSSVLKKVIQQIRVN